MSGQHYVTIAPFKLGGSQQGVGNQNEWNFQAGHNQRLQWDTWEEAFEGGRSPFYVIDDERKHTPGRAKC